MDGLFRDNLARPDPPQCRFPENNLDASGTQSRRAPRPVLGETGQRGQMFGSSSNAIVLVQDNYEIRLNLCSAAPSSKAEDVPLHPA
ncbi:hypothetical protein EYF80_061894 [Liparis tanakae]|uniref:Uncharacterized protein n=1 Tax=Liparis tanakae TaxID=230148 RepID=A0A4Z2EGR3_9TELE|nr:hypothetical protein EYF80_061894 [Liparis tanakae]